MTVIGPIVMVAGWLAILTLGNAPAVAIAVSGPVLLALALRGLMPRPGRPVPPPTPTAVDAEARHIRTFAESLGMPPRQERERRDSER